MVEAFTPLFPFLFPFPQIILAAEHLPPGYYAVLDKLAVGYSLLYNIIKLLQTVLIGAYCVALAAFA
jgi:hypothetical protein